MICPNCNKEFDETFDFCPYCGKEAPKIKICPDCGFESFEYNFCPKCGIKLLTKTEEHKKEVQDNNYTKNEKSSKIRTEETNTNISENKLSPAQINAACSPAKKLIINAGPGAGKTRVLIERVKYLLNEVDDVHPESLLVITFTEKAAKEIEDRLNKDPEISYEEIDQMQIGTIHSFCRTFLRKYVSSGIEVIDDEDSDKKILFLKKNLKRLVPDKYAYFTDLELKKVAERFDEIASFDIDTKRLEKTITKRYFMRGHEKKDKLYREFIDEKLEETNKFPLSEIVENDEYERRRLAHNFLAIAKAYDTYKELYDERKSYDFNLLQSKTRDALKKDEELRKKVVYKNILIDEFQDTDRVQFEIFEMLKEYSNYVTYVGDINQSIYRWRGSTLRNFDKLINEKETNGFEVIDLLKNYRSPKNIVEFNNKFMTRKMPLIANNQNDGDLYYLNSRDRGEQAKKIVEVIKYLKENNKIENYFDVGLLFRSTTIFQLEALLNELNANDIKYHIKGFSDFQDYAEVQAIILILWYLTKTMPKNKTFKLNEFANPDLNKVMFKLSAETREILENYEGSPQEFSKMDLIDLRVTGITNKRDLYFFDGLNKLKNRFWNENNLEDKNKLDLLNLYYDLFEITGYVVDTFKDISIDDIDSNSGLLNLALISNKINDFMETYDRYDLDSFFEFIFNYYTQYSSPANSAGSEDAVQISTIHGAKGLEFPVVFICSLLEGGFPRRDPLKKTIEDYPIPDKLKYHELFDELMEQGRDITIDYPMELNKEYRAEEQRVLYVGLTRAQSTLIVSHILNKGRRESREFKIMKESNPDFKELKLNNLGELSIVEPTEEPEDDLELSFTSLGYYEKCPRLFNLIQNYDFVNPQNVGMRIGTILHAVLDKINKEIVSNDGEISIEFIDNVINEAIESNPDLKGNETFLELLDAVKSYCNTIDITFIGADIDKIDEFFGYDEYTAIKRRVRGSEYPFTIPWHDSKLRGSIDLILENDKGSVDLIDFKITEEENIREEYMKAYYNQLHFYFMAMQQNSNYHDILENTKLQIYSLGDREYINVRLDENRIRKLNEDVMTVSEKINAKEYSPNEESCDKCLLRSLCCK